MGSEGIPHPKDIYLEIEAFKKLGSACHIDASGQLLEAYEKRGLFFPIYQINLPRKYLQTIFEQERGQSRHSGSLSIPKLYESLWHFENREQCMWNHPKLPGFEKVLKDGHPLEQAHNRGERFIVRPSKKPFKKWDKNEAVLEAQYNGQVIKNRVSTIKRYYSPWQIYLLEELNRRHIRKINVLVKLKKGERYILSEPPSQLRLAEWQGHFNALWEYKFKENLVFAKDLESIDGNILEGAAARRFHETCKGIAIATFSKHSYKSWIEFIRILCGLYFEYQEEEKVKLSRCVKRDIKSTIDFIRQGAGKNYFELIDDVGMVIDGTQFLDVPPLERIYPEYERYLGREAFHEIESTLKYYNNAVPCDLKLNEKAVDEIIDHAFKGGNETLLVSIVGIHQEYFEPSYFGDEGIWSYVRSLSIAIESWTKNLSGKGSFEAAINSLVGKDFERCLDQLAKSCGRKDHNDLRINNLSDLKLFLKEIAGVQPRATTVEQAWMEHILRAYIIRNYAAHHTKLESDLFGSAFIEIYNSLMFLVFYSWKVRGRP